MTTSCKNLQDVVVQGHYDSKIIKFKCGDTDHHGHRVTCDSCLNDPEERARIIRHQANVDADNSWLRSAGWGEI